MFITPVVLVSNVGPLQRCVPTSFGQLGQRIDGRGNNPMMIFSVFTLAGIGLCIAKHRGWGIFCFAIVVIYGFLSL